MKETILIILIFVVSVTIPLVLTQPSDDPDALAHLHHIELLLRNLNVTDVNQVIHNVSQTHIVNNTYHQTYYGSNLVFYPRAQRTCKNPIEWSVYGNSMTPLFYNNDKIDVEPVRFNQIELGDVIVFTNPNDKDTTVIHAVVYLTDEYIKTAGYSNLRIDNFTVTKEMVQYRYCVR